MEKPWFPVDFPLNQPNVYRVSISTAQFQPDFIENEECRSERRKCEPKNVKGPGSWEKRCLQRSIGDGSKPWYRAVNP